MKQAPTLGGWVFGAMLGAVAVGLTRIVWDWPWAASLFIGVLLFVVVGLIVGMPGSEKFERVNYAPAAPAPQAQPTAAKPVPTAAPAPLMSAVAPEARRKPEALTAARGGKADDLKIIKGIGPKLEDLCHKLGFFHFDQVAAWTAEEAAWVDENLEGFKGRVTRDRWVPQAKAIAAMGPEAFLRRLDAGEEF